VTHAAKFVDASVRHVLLTPPDPTWRAAFIGGIHGDEMPARLAPAQIVRSMIFGRRFFAGPAELASCEIIVIPEGHPEACALGLRDGDGNGDLNCSWPGVVHPRYSSARSVARAAEVADLLLAYRPAVVVGLHSMNGTEALALTQAQTALRLVVELTTVHGVSSNCDPNNSEHHY
jgi:predicted deacylase